jgi:hypothetical protein
LAAPRAVPLPRAGTIAGAGALTADLRTLLGELGAARAA